MKQRGLLSTLDPGPHGSGIKIQSRAVASWDGCVCKCCHSEGVLGLMLHSDSIRSRRSAPVEENIEFTTMGVK